MPARIGFPVDLGGGLPVTADNVTRFFKHTEKDTPRGFFPLGASRVWHGGVHLYASEGTPVFSMFEGHVVAARLNPDPAKSKGDFGGTNFIVVRHELKGTSVNAMNPGDPFKASDNVRFFSIYFHLGAVDLSITNPVLAKVAWLTKPLPGEITSSVGRGGANKKGEVKLVQNLLIRAGFNPGTADDAIGPKTIGAIEAFQSQYLFTNPDGRIDPGGASWKMLRTVASGEPAKDGFDEDLLKSLQGGNLVLTERPIRGGQQLFVVGPDGGESKSKLVHWEIISAVNVLKGLKEVNDESPFTADVQKILPLIGDWKPSTPPTAEEVAKFYATHAAAPKLRDLAVRFPSEWSGEAADIAEALKGHFYTVGLADKLTPYLWYDPDALGPTGLPPALHWHYNPIKFLELMQAAELRRTIPPPPAPSPTPVDTSDDDDAPSPSPGPVTPPPDPDKLDDVVLLYDAQTDLVYALEKKEYQALLAANAKLREKKAALQQAMAAAAGKDMDQRLNAVRPHVDELLKLTTEGGNVTSGVPNIDEAKRKKELVTELWAMTPDGGKRPIYVGPEGSKRALQRALVKKPIKQMYRAARSEKTKHIADIKFELIDEDMKKKYPYLQGGGSLLDFIDSSNPGVVARIFGGVTGMDAFFEKFPRIFRKGLQGAWESEGGNLDASVEARLLRWSYETSLGGVFSPDKGKAEFKGKLGGSVDLIRGKAEANAYVVKDGFPIPLTEGGELKFRFHFKGEVSGSVGAAAELSAGAAVSWKPDPDGFYGARADAGLDLFVGAQATGKITAGIEWFNENKWNPLAEASAGATGIAGAALVARFYMDFNAKTGKFEIYLKAQLALKLGVGFDYAMQIHAIELAKFLWTLMTKADWGKITELSFDAFIKASQMLAASAVQGVMLPGQMAYSLLSSFAGWWESQDKINQLATNITGGKAGVLMQYGTPEAKGMTIYQLCQRSAWLSDEKAEVACLAVLKSAKSKKEAEAILKSIDPKGRDPKASLGERAVARTTERGYQIVSSLVDWSEQDQLDAYMDQYGFER